EIQDALKKLEPDFFVTFAFGQILSQEVLDIPKYETINLHASLLPKYRGASPI
ncbi:MAG: methionyl-tRNA formyltransferase, partial [Mycoplasmataceae bacterium]|nr:methionyl-tRNA formyltransferase [Mycoplasmataceae bacterium]